MLELLLADTALVIMATGALVGSAATLVGVFLVLRKTACSRMRSATRSCSELSSSGC